MKKLKMDRVTLSVILFLISFIVYLPALKAPFFWDDDLLIPALKDEPTVMKYTEFRPLRGVSFYFDSFLWKTNASGYHFTNIFLNAIASVVAFIFIEHFFKNKIFAFLVALIFSLHPVHTETVVWINNRAEILFFIFFVLSFLAFFKKRWLVWPFFILSLLAKESAAIFPVVLTLYLFIFGKKEEIKKTAPLWILAGVRLAVSVLWLPELVGSARLPNLATHILAVIKTYAFYFYLLIFPGFLSVDWTLNINPQNPYNWFSAFALAGFFMLLWFWRREKPALFFILLLFVSLLPYSNIFFISGRPWAEQRLYLPSLSFCVLLGLIINRWKPALKTLKTGAAAFVILFYGGRTFLRANQWQDIESILMGAKRFSPQNARIELSLGNVYSEKGDFARARGCYMNAMKLDREYSLKALYNLGLAFMKSNDSMRAGECFGNALMIDPENVPSLYNLGLLYLREKNYKEAIKTLEKARKISPTEYQIYNNLAVAYKRDGQILKAAEVLEEVLELNPDYYSARYNLSIIYQEAGLLKEAMEETKYVLSKFPGDPAFLKLYQEIKEGYDEK